jgi:hypothetical protein
MLLDLQAGLVSDLRNGCHKISKVSLYLQAAFPDYGHAPILIPELGPIGASLEFFRGMSDLSTTLSVIPGLDPGISW